MNKEILQAVIAVSVLTGMALGVFFTWLLLMVLVKVMA